MLRKPSFVDEKTEKQYYLSKIGNKLTAIAAYNLKLEEKIYWNPSRRKVDKWKESFMKFPLKRFHHDLLPYYMSGSVSTHLYILEKKSVKRIRGLTKDQEKFIDYASLLKDLYPEFFFSSEIITLLVKIPLRVRYQLIEDEDEDKLLVKPIRPFEDIWVVFHPELGILEIRTNNSNHANRILARLKKEFRINCRSVKFTLNEMKSFFDWIINISNSHIRYETGAISSARYTSAIRYDGTRESLLRTGEFIDAMDRGRIISAYGYIPYSFLFPENLLPSKSSPDPETEGVNSEEEESKIVDQENEDNEIIQDSGAVKGMIGFNVNFEMGKVYFNTALSEFEISIMIQSIIKHLDLKSKRDIHPPATQTRLNPRDYSQIL